MTDRELLMAALLLYTFIVSSCQSAPKHIVLPASPGMATNAARHYDEGVLAYQQGPWDSAREHFESAITAAPDSAEAHYNLGMTLYRLGNLREGDRHFMKAANLAPGNKVIWDAPPLRNVSIPEKEVAGPASDGHMHSH